MTEYNVAININYYEDDKFIGSATIFEKDKFLCNFEINPEYRNMGYGQKFLQYLIDTYDIQSLDVLDKNDVAQHIYKKFALRMRGETQDVVKR